MPRSSLFDQLGRVEVVGGTGGQIVDSPNLAANPALAGSLLARAMTDAELTGEPVVLRLSVAAHAAGRAIGEEGAAEHGPFTSNDDATRAVLDLLARHGYAPLVKADEIALIECPFHGLAEEHRSLACRMNLDFLSGLLEGIGCTDRLGARLVPDSAYCCVRVNAC